MTLPARRLPGRWAVHRDETSFLERAYGYFPAFVARMGPPTASWWDPAGPAARIFSPSAASRGSMDDARAPAPIRPRFAACAAILE